MITLIGDATNGLSPIGGAGADIQRFEEMMEQRSKEKIEYWFENEKKF
jgi:hypothetical protein